MRRCPDAGHGDIGAFPQAHCVWFSVVPLAKSIPKMKFVLPLLLALWVSPVFVESLTGKVVGVSDGDTITVLDAGKAQHKIRLAGIDAPEKA